MTPLPCGVGLGWRDETAWLIHQRANDLPFTELIAESVPVRGPLPRALEQRLEGGMVVIPHGVSLGLGDATRPCKRRLRRLAKVAKRLGAPLVSEHIAFVRGGGLETEHLLPVARTRANLDIVVDNVRRAQDALPVPLAIENIALLLDWDSSMIPEGEFIAELLDRTGALLLLDLSNLHANTRNFGWDARAFLDALPLARLAYAHVAGGVQTPGFYYDTHAHAVGEDSLALLAELHRRVGPVPVLLERDDHFGTRADLEAELDAIARCMPAQVVTRAA